MKLEIQAPKFDIHNKYEFKLIDTRTNEVKQEAVAYNAANSSRYTSGLVAANFVNLASTNWWGPCRFLVLGTGVGKVSKNDTTLFTYSTSLAIDSFSHVAGSPYSFSGNNAYSATVTFPATTSYVGAYTEVGIGPFTNALISHALLQDSEGNPITIKKTSFDILIVTVTLYFSVQVPNKAPFNFKYLSPAFSPLAGHHTSTIFNSLYPRYATLPAPFAGGKGSLDATSNVNPSIHLCSTYVNEEGMYSSMPMNYTQCYSAYYSTRWQLSKYADTTWPARYYLTNGRKEQSDVNTGYAHSIYVDNLGYIPLPNEDVLPRYAYKDIIVGTGNNENTNFYTPVNEVVSTSIYIDGKQASDAYFVDYNIKRSPLWNKAIRVEWYESADADAAVVHRENLFTAGSDGDTTKSLSEYANVLLTDTSVNIAWLSDHESTYDEVRMARVMPGHYSAVIYYDPAGITLDHVRFGGIYIRHGSVSNYSATRYPIALRNPLYYLEYSEDGTNWQTALDCTVLTYLDCFKGHYFDVTTAPYWRIRSVEPRSYYTESSSTSTTMSYAEYCPALTDTHKSSELTSTSTFDSRVCWYANNTSSEHITQTVFKPNWFAPGYSAQHDFGKVGVNFATPPAKGAVITMDAVLNLPYKDNNIVYTLSCEIQINDPDPDQE